MGVKCGGLAAFLVSLALSSPLPSPEETKVSDIFISVKTTQKFHKSRIPLILDTWYNLAPHQVYFFTDSHDEKIERVTGSDHWIVTGCSSDHTRQALCCKMASEIDNFLHTKNKWFCHFDDDNYVNVGKLGEALSQFDPAKDFYVGKPSTRHPIDIYVRERSPNRVSFWFATGGAGFCISRALAHKMAPIAAEGRLMTVGDKIRLPDDVTVGYVLEHLLGRKLTVLDQFHSHLEMLRNIPEQALAQQISLSYGGYGREENTIFLPGYFSNIEDPSRIRSLHCHLFPAHAKKCPNR